MRRHANVFALWLFIAGLCFLFSESVSTAQSEQVQIEDVHVRLSSHGPVVLLAAQNKTIPIFVDQTVAGSIHGALTGVKLRRPLSHDLMHAILEAYDGRVTKVEITLKDRIYYGALSVTLQGAEKVFDSRSSDAIALAIHFEAPILVGRDLLDSADKAEILKEGDPSTEL